MLEAFAVGAFSDNYIWHFNGPRDRKRVAIVDPGDAEPVLQALEQRELEPAAILITHHHFDHVSGLPALRERFDVPVFGPGTSNIAGIDHEVGDGDTVHIDALGVSFDVLATPGHTLDHIAYFGHGSLFCGDTLFSAGCGRLFEGTPAQMRASLARLRDLDPHTHVYCTHEYTIANLRFAAAVEPDNHAIEDYAGFADRKRAWGEPTLPSTLGLEKRVNPFLRWDEASVAEAASRHAGRTLTDADDIFAAVRHWKDTF